MKRTIIALILAAIMTLALVSCNDSGNESSVTESSIAQDAESSVAETESSIADESSEAVSESSAADESSEAVSEIVSESETSEDKKEEIKVIISLEHASEELLNSTEEFPFYQDPDTDYGYVVFKTDTSVTNFRYFSVVSTDTWSDDGAPMIDDVLYTIDEFTPDMIFVAETVFADVYAVRGISFVDANGNTQYYTLHDSAVDDTMGVSRADIAEKE